MALLWEECKRLGGCGTGEAKITEGYRLPAHYVIHTVGPVYSGSRRDAELLEACYRNTLKLALERGINTVAFPAISTGTFGYPMRKAAEIALRTTIDFLKHHDEISSVRFVLYGSNDLRVHEERLKEIAEDSEIELIET